MTMPGAIERVPCPSRHTIEQDGAQFEVRCSYYEGHIEQHYFGAVWGDEHVDAQEMTVEPDADV